MSSDENEERDLKKLTVKELRARAVKALGSKVAAGLKLKQELVDALVQKAAKAVKKAPAKVAKQAETVAKKVETAARKVEKKVEAVAKKAAPTAKKTPPKKRATPPRAAKRAAPAKAPTPPRMTKPSKAEAMAEVYELPITRDFFVDPRRPSLPAAYGDDRLLCFRREPLAIVVSWDLAAATFADGQGLRLELVTLQGRLVGAQTVTAPTGLATFETLPEGEGLQAQLVKQGRVVTRGRSFMIGSARPAGAAAEGERAPPRRMTVAVDQPLPEEPVAEEWVDAPERTPVKGGRLRAASSRLSS